MNKLLNSVLKKIDDGKSVVIVGAGSRGKQLFNLLKNEHPESTIAFFDNNLELQGTAFEHVKIMRPHKITDCACVYIVANDNQECRESLCIQLQDLGIESEDIIEYYKYRDYEYLSNLDEKCYKEEISDMYYECFGRNMNWQTPKTYNEKINWEKVNVRDERRTKLADKYLVREWVREKIGEEHLTKLYGVWDDAHDIDFDSLPNSFVLKVNNGSTRNIVIKNKSDMNRAEVCRQLNDWKEHNFAYSGLELHYRDIVPKIICEEYLEGLADDIYDYNIYCFHGEPAYIWCIKGSHKQDCMASFYDKNWEMQPFSYGYPKDPVPAPRPEKLDKMLELSRILCKEFEHVRVDWYNLPDGRVLFGEMTFSTWSGLMHFVPEAYDTVFGNLI